MKASLTILTRLTGCCSAMILTGMPGDRPPPLFTAESYRWAAWRVLELTNQARAQHGAPPVCLSGKLMISATQYSLQQVKAGRITHHLYPSLEERFSSVNFKCRSYSENLAGRMVYDPDNSVTGWLASKKGHRENLLNPMHTHMGIGIVISPTYYTYWTQHFATPWPGEYESCDDGFIPGELLSQVNSFHPTTLNDLKAMEDGRPAPAAQAAQAAQTSIMELPPRGDGQELAKVEHAGYQYQADQATVGLEYAQQQFIASKGHLIIGGIVALVVGGLMYYNWESLQEKGRNLWNWIKRSPSTPPAHQKTIDIPQQLDDGAMAGALAENLPPLPKSASELLEIINDGPCSFRTFIGYLKQALIVGKWAHLSLLVLNAHKLAPSQVMERVPYRERTLMRMCLGNVQESLELLLKPGPAPVFVQDFLHSVGAHSHGKPIVRFIQNNAPKLASYQAQMAHIMARMFPRENYQLPPRLLHRQHSYTVEASFAIAYGHLARALIGNGSSKVRRLNRAHRHLAKIQALPPHAAHIILTDVLIREAHCLTSHNARICHTAGLLVGKMFGKDVDFYRLDDAQAYHIIVYVVGRPNKDKQLVTLLDRLRDDPPLWSHLVRSFPRALERLQHVKLGKITQKLASIVQDSHIQPYPLCAPPASQFTLDSLGKPIIPVERSLTVPSQWQDLYDTLERSERDPFIRGLLQLIASDLEHPDLLPPGVGRQSGLAGALNNMIRQYCRSIGQAQLAFAREVKVQK